ncbi:MAG: LLM class flavin-dependent oxidoreductase [Chloroflexota bacterium]|nr:LLM class flavin-dependent oxidoreductase [Chloroflexota bacterium]
MRLEFGLYVGVGSPAVPLHEQAALWAEHMKVARDNGFTAVAAPHHWLAHPAAFFQPLLTLARLAAEPGDMALVSSVVQLPLYSPVDMAEQVASLDQISGGRFVLGVGLGYREQLFEAAGARKLDRAGRFEESIALMTRLWTGEETTFHGRHFRLTSGRISLRPYQQPHPPIWIGAQSQAGVARAARLGDAWFMPPQASWSELEQLTAHYRTELRQAGKSFPDRQPLMRSLVIGRSHREAIAEARVALNDLFAYYRPLGLQEESTVRLHLSIDEEIARRSIVGDAQECADEFQRYIDLTGATFFLLRLGKPGAEKFQTFQQIGLLGSRVLPRLRLPKTEGTA